MRIDRLGAWVILGLCLTTSVPVAATLWMWQARSAELQTTLVGDIANQALGQSERVANELKAAAKVMNSLEPGTECTPRGRAVMHHLNLDSSLIRGVGYLQGNKVICSNFTEVNQFDLGDPDHFSKIGVKNWANVRLFDGDQSFLASGWGHFVGIINKTLRRDYLIGRPDLKVGTFAWTDPDLMYDAGDRSLGQLLAQYHQPGVFKRGNKLIAIAKSKDYDLATVASMPIYSPPLASKATWLPLLIGIAAATIMSFMFLMAVRSQMSLPNRLRAAIRNRELKLRYQPIVDLDTGSMIGAEALVRWHPQDGEIIKPDAFIPLAEMTGVISHITGAVLDIIESDIQRILSVKPDFQFSVNFSADDVHSPQMADRITALIERLQLERGTLIVEVTERSFTDVTVAQHNLERMRTAGAKIAIDDFGTGYSCLSILARLKVDGIKIDKQFVQALGIDSATSSVASRIIDMAGDLGAYVVAEGIETHQQINLLRDLGVRFGQGYLFATPLTVQELLDCLGTEASVVIECENTTNYCDGGLKPRTKELA